MAGVGGGLKGRRAPAASAFKPLKPFACIKVLRARSGAARSGEADGKMDPAAPALVLEGLKKSFDRPAVDGLDLTIRGGEFYGLPGPQRGRQDHHPAHGGRPAEA